MLPVRRWPGVNMTNRLAVRVSIVRSDRSSTKPVPTGDVTVKIAPMQNETIRSAVVGDVVAIDRSAESARPAPRYWEIRKREGNRVEMESELGIENWGSSTKQFGYSTVDLDGDGVIRTSMSVKMVLKTDPTSRPSIRTEYQCGKTPEKIVVEYEHADGEWRKATVDGKNPEVKVPLAKHLRITRLDRNVVIDDRYAAPNSAEVPKAIVKYLPQDLRNPVSHVSVLVTVGEVQVNKKTPTVCIEREIRMSALPG